MIQFDKNILVVNIISLNKAKILQTIILEMDCGSMYDTAGEVLPAVQSRLSRRILPRITEEGCVQYGVQIPQNYASRLPRSARVGANISSGSKFGPEGIDIDWILKGSGSLSRGSTGSNVIPQVTVTTGSGNSLLPTSQRSQFGSTLSLRNEEYTDQDSYRSKPGTQHVRSIGKNGENDVPGYAPRDSWNRHRPIPGIR